MSESAPAVESWVNYSEMDQTKFTGSLTIFSLVSSFLTHPLNLITTRQQSGRDKSSGNILQDMKMTARTVGFRGLFRGWLPIATMGLPSNVIYLIITESSRESLQNKIKMIYPNILPLYLDSMQSFISSIAANAVSLIPYVPADVISCRLITQQGKTNIGTIRMMKTILAESGVKGFYKGFQVSLIFNSIFSFNWWLAYSQTRRFCVGYKSLNDNPLAIDVISGVSAGVAATSFLHPLDTIKTRIMTSQGVQGGKLQTGTNILQIFRTIVRNDGYLALYHGLPASMYQSVISSAGFALVYELIKRFALKTVDIEESKSK